MNLALGPGTFEFGQLDKKKLHKHPLRQGILFKRKREIVGVALGRGTLMTTGSPLQVVFLPCPTLCSGLGTPQHMATCSPHVVLRALGLEPMPQGTRRRHP